MFDQNESWDDAQQVRSETSGGVFLRLKDGEEALVVFPGKPFAYRQVWNQRENKSEIYDPAKHDGLRPQGRFSFPVFCPVPGKKEYEAKVFDASGETFDTIKDCRTEYGPATLYKVKRKGSGTDTKYNVMFSRPLSEAEIEHIKSLQPLDVEALTLGTGRDQTPASDAPKGSDPWA